MSFESMITRACGKFENWVSGSKEKKQSNKSGKEEKTKAAESILNPPNHENITSVAKTALLCPHSNLEWMDLFDRFNSVIEILKDTQNLEKYEAYLKEAEKILVLVEKGLPMIEDDLFKDLKEGIKEKMRIEYELALQNMPKEIVEKVEVTKSTLHPPNHKKITSVAKNTLLCPGTNLEWGDHFDRYKSVIDTLNSTRNLEVYQTYLKEAEDILILVEKGLRMIKDDLFRDFKEAIIEKMREEYGLALANIPVS